MSGIHHMLFIGGGSGVVISNPLGFNGSTFTDDPGSGGSASAQMLLYSNGQWEVFITVGGTVDSGNWATPTTTGIGNNYWVKFTLGLNSGVNSWSTINPSATTGWLQLNSTRSCLVTATDALLARSAFANFTIEISTDSSGTNIVSTSTIELVANSTP